MANERTIMLSGTEQEVKISGQNCDIRNDGVDIIYASRRSSVVAGEDGVLSIPAGQAAKLLDTGGRVYLLGTGSVMLCGNDYAELVFKSAATSSGEGGTADDVARQAISAHSGNAEIHLTAEKAIEAAATTISNPNLLRNPDFRINQRGKTEYTAGYSVDGWDAVGTVRVNDDYIVTYGGNFIQNVDIPVPAGTSLAFSAKLCGKEAYIIIGIVAMDGSVHWLGSTDRAVTSAAPEAVVVSATVTLNQAAKEIVYVIKSEDTAAEVEAYWARLELGTVATPFVPPDPAVELAKCQRYYQIHTTGDIDPVDLRPSMRITPTVTQLDDGNYEYNAEW